MKSENGSTKGKDSTPKLKPTCRLVQHALWELFKDKLIFGPTPMQPAPPQYDCQFQISKPADIPEKVYRFFDKPEHADDFANGRLWISTLERCRQYEDPKQGDKHEGMIARLVDDLKLTDGRNTKTQMLAQSMGIKVPASDINISIKNSTFVTRLADGLVLCTTLKYAPDTLSDNFGKHCVEISNPHEFFKTLTQSLLSTYPMIAEAVAGPIIYEDRVAPIHKKISTHIGLIKPSDPYAEQEEYRMLWLVKHNIPLTPGIINVPALADYCRRIA